MFAGLINQAKSAASHLVLKYVARASVAVPFVIAAGFALAAITVMLVERFGHVMAYWLVAGGLALIGVITSSTTRICFPSRSTRSTPRRTAACRNARYRRSGQSITETSRGRSSVARHDHARRRGSDAERRRAPPRNLASVLLLAMISALIWPSKQTEEDVVQ